MRSVKKLMVCLCVMAASLLMACGDSKESTIIATTVATPTLSDETKTAEATTPANTAETIAVPATGTEVKGTGYSLTFPANWVASSSEASDMVMLNANSKGNFTTNFNVVIEDVSAYGSAITAETYCEAAKRQFASEPAFKITGTQKVTVNGEEAYTLTCDVSESGFSYMVKQLYVVSNGNAYVTTFSAGADDYAADLPEGDSILATFKITK
ncbi:MAG: PsbP-related protein [Eubacteriales bacterium]|nr:PsbP-related protein [Eubacteriales bacterium]